MIIRICQIKSNHIIFTDAHIYLTQWYVRCFIRSKNYVHKTTFKNIIQGKIGLLGKIESENYSTYLIKKNREYLVL